MRGKSAQRLLFGRGWGGEVVCGFDWRFGFVKLWCAWGCAVATLTPRPPLPPAGEGGKRVRMRSLARDCDCASMRSVGVKLCGAWGCAVTTLTPRPPLPPAGEGEKRTHARARALVWGRLGCCGKNQQQLAVAMRKYGRRGRGHGRRPLPLLRHSFLRTKSAHENH